MWRRGFGAIALVLVAISCRQVLGLGDDPLPYGPDGGERPVVTADNSECGANLVTDPEHCGRCGHGCRGGRCERGRCTPIPVLQGADAPLLSVIDGRVYTLTQEHIVRVEAQIADGGSIPPAFKVVDKAVVAGIPRAILANASHIVWSNDQGVRLCSITGCGADGAEALSAAKKTGPITRIAEIHPTFPYAWASFADGTVEKYGSPPGVLSTDTRVEGASCPPAFATVNGGAYLADAPGKRIRYYRADAGTVAAAVEDICAIAASGNNVFYTDSTNVWRTTMDVDGGLAPPTAIATNVGAPQALATDDEYVYWAASTAETAIVRCRQTGCEGPPEVVVEALPAIEAIAVEGPAVYFSVLLNTTLGRVIYKVAK